MRTHLENNFSKCDFDKYTLIFVSSIYILKQSNPRYNFQQQNPLILQEIQENSRIGEKLENLGIKGIT